MKDESLVEVPRGERGFTAAYIGLIRVSSTQSDQKVHVPHAAEHLDGPPSNGLNNLAGGGIEDHHRSNGHINGQHRLVGVQEPPQLTQAHSDQHSDDGHKPLQHTQPLALAQEVAHEQQQLPRGLLHPPAVQALYKHEHVLNPVHRCPRDIAEDQPTNLQPSNAMAGQHVQNQRAAPPEQEVPQNQDPQGTHAQGEWMGTRHPLQGHHSADQKTGPHGTSDSSNTDLSDVHCQCRLKLVTHHNFALLTDPHPHSPNVLTELI